PGRIDMEQRERRRRWVERLARQVQHDRAVLADRIEHHRVVRLGDNLAHDMDALGLEAVEVRQTLHGRQLPIAGANRKARAGEKFFATRKLCPLPSRGWVTVPSPQWIKVSRKRRP